MSKPPLSGYTILDFTQFYQGPYATFMAAKAGADVIKIEPPGGESLRLMAPPGKETSMPVAMLNANNAASPSISKATRARISCASWC
jgi:CoA:oxalate CoA-transferase